MSADNPVAGFRGSRMASRGRRALAANASSLRLGFGALLLSSTGDLIAGVALGSMSAALESLPGLLLLVPAAIGMRGNIFGALGARLGTLAHTGRFEKPWQIRSATGQSVAGSCLLTVYVSVAVAVLAWLITTLMGLPHIGLADFLVISVIGGVASSVLVLFVTVSTARVAVRRGWDLDNVAAPVVTAIGDIVTLPALWLAAFLIRPQWLAYTLAIVCVAVVVPVALWQYRHRVLKQLQQVVRQSLPLLLIAGTVDILAGYVLDSRTEAFLAMPGLLVMVPAFLEDVGALGSILASRLASKLHLGTLRPGRLPGRAVLTDIVLIGILGFPVFLLLGLTVTGVSAALGLAHPSLLMMLALTLLAGFFATSAAVVVAYYAAVGTFRLRLDPDNYGLPIITSTMDLVGTLSIAGGVVVLGLV